MQKVVSFIENAGSATDALKTSGTPSNTPGQTLDGFVFQGDITDSWSNPFKNAPGGPNVQNHPSPWPFLIDAICSPALHLLLNA